MVAENKKKLFLGAFFLFLVLSIPLTLNLVQQRQEERSRATGSTTLSFTPNSSTGSPLQKNVGDTISLDMMVNPGSNLVTFVKFQISYDPTKLEPVGTDPFALNNASFPTKVEGPVLGSGTIAEAVSVGSDPTKAIQTTTKVGTVTFKAIGGTGTTPTTVGFSNLTQALSSASSDQAAENVLSTTSPALIAIAGDNATPSAVPTGTSTTLSFSVLLHGIGAAGDNPNPSGNSLSNKNPLHPQRDLDVQIYDSNNQLVTTTSGSLNFDTASGAFIGEVDLGANFPKGNYSLKLKSDRYLRKRVPGIQAINNLENNTVPQVALVAGDTNGDNVLNVLDYNAFLDCGYGALNPLPMADPNAIFNTQACQVHTPIGNVDLDDNGIINSPDYNLFLRELSVQNGD